MNTFKKDAIKYHWPKINGKINHILLLSTFANYSGMVKEQMSTSQASGEMIEVAKKLILEKSPSEMKEPKATK